MTPLADSCASCVYGSLGELALPGEHTKAGHARNRSVWVWESVSVGPDIRFHILTHSHTHMRPRSRKMRCLASRVSLGRASSPSEPLSQGRPQWVPPVAQRLGDDWVPCSGLTHAVGFGYFSPREKTILRFPVPRALDLGGINVLTSIHSDCDGSSHAWGLRERGAGERRSVARASILYAGAGAGAPA